VISSFIAPASVKTQYDLTDRICLITGGAGFLGRQFAEAVGEMGAMPVLLDVSEGELAKAAEQVRSVCGRCDTERVDVCDEQSLAEVAERILLRYGRIDILINNAGITQDARLVKMTEAQFDTVIDVNLKGVFNCTQLVVPHMLETGKGAIVNASSVVGIYGNFGQTNYSATKFGVIGFTKTWARELGPKGIRVNAVCPGFIATEMVKAMPENILKDIERRSWLGRLGTPEEMSNVYLFLASDEASYVNGVALEASGGISL